MFLFFVLQISIKGSKAGNAQTSKGEKQPSPQQQIVFEDEDIIKITNFEEEQQREQNGREGKEENAQIQLELVAPKARQATSFVNDKGPETEALALSMLRLSFPPRPKTHSRQSHGISSGEQTPGMEYDWVDTNSEVSVSSTLAKRLFSPDDRKHEPIAFEELCAYLESAAPMNDEELLALCRRILKNDLFIKALNLPVYLKDFDENINAIKIHDILYAYLGQSGDLMSRCSSRTSTIDTPPNSPINRLESPEQKHSNANEPGIGVEEMFSKTISTNPISIPHPQIQPVDYFLARGRMVAIPSSYFPRTLGLKSLHLTNPAFNVMSRMPLDPVREERSSSDITEIIGGGKLGENDGNEENIIEEID